MFERTASLWQRLTGRTRGTPAAAVGDLEDERRFWVRHPSNAETKLIPVGEEAQTPLPARVADVSQGGIKLVVSRPFEPGSMLTVILPGEGQSSLTVLACVVHCLPLSETEWGLGCSFSAELEEAQLQVFGARKAKAASSDDRNWTRFPCNVKAVCRLATDPEGPPWPAKVLNISATGMALELAQEVPPGNLLSADLEGSQNLGTLTILACIVHVTVQQNGQRITGCNFIRELSESDLAKLL